MEEIEKLWEEVRDLSLGSSIPRLESPPSPLEFLRNFVSQNKPCIISNSISHWPALSLWPNPTYLSSSLSNSPVSLHLTPHGRADSLIPIPSPSTSSHCFASAHVQRLPFPQALRAVMGSKKGECVGYLQEQNDCLRSEYKVVGEDCDGDVGFATEAFGCYPEAVNLWIGNDKSETGFHKDHYENIYGVVCGVKEFLLLPPTDVHRLYVKDYPAANYSYSQENGEFKLEMEEPTRYVPWCSVNPYPSPEDKESEMAKFPLYFNGPKPFQCTVKAGELLYLPSMWFHHVRQRPDEKGCTIAVNYWYDMQFDIKYAYFNFLQSIHYKLPSTQIRTGNSKSHLSVWNLGDKAHNAVSVSEVMISNQDSEDE